MVPCNYCQVNECAINKNGKYKQYCSTHCQSTHTVEKRIITNLKKYGTSNPMLLTSVKDKRDQTNLRKFGVKNPFSLQEVQEKYKKTCLEKFNVEHASQSPAVKTKIKTAWEKYSNGHPFRDVNVRNKRDATMVEKYGVKHPAQCKEIHGKIEKTCIEKYNVPNPSLNALVKNKISNSLTNGMTQYLNDREWLETCVSELGTREAAELLQVSGKCVRDYCDKHQIPFRKENRGSEFEQQVYLELSKLIEQQNIVRGDKTLIGKELDIYIPTKKLAIECNGTYWHSELNGRGKNYHVSKTKLCAEHNIHLVHIWEHTWLANKQLVLSRLKALLGQNQRIYARKCQVKEVSSKTATEFLMETHIQGSSTSSVRLGLYFEGSLVALMTFGKSRFTQKYQYELIRFSTALGTSVIGGAGKLFTYFLKTYLPNIVVSYSDRSFNKGKLYEKLGFFFSHRSAPAYHYTKDYSIIESRVKYQKHKMKNILPIFDPNISEWDNMKNNGYDRIWDCGNDVWVYAASS